MISQTSWAGKIYRWTDAEGHVHFSSTPGPNQAADADQGSSKTPSKHTDYAVRNIFSGTWRGSSRTVTVELRFNRKGNILQWKSMPRGGGVQAESFNARWQYQNGDLEVVYINHQQDAHKNGTRAVYKIIDKSADTLVLQSPDGKVFRLHKRAKYKKLTYIERKFIGKWQLQNDQQEEWGFSSRGFMIKGRVPHQTGIRTLASGSWKVQGDTLIMTHLNDNFILKKTHRTGEIQKFAILLREDAQLILKAMTSKKELVFQRKR